MQKITHDDTVVAFVLNDTLIIDESKFNTLDSATRASILVSNKDGVSNFDFRPTFSDLTNRSKLRERLKAGEDVSLELAFNEVEVPAEFLELQKAYHSQVASICDNLQDLYPFAEVPHDGTRLKVVGKAVSNGSHKCGIKTAENLWKRVAPYWAGQAVYRPNRVNGSFNGYTRDAIFYNNRIEIGCQTIERWQVEQLALELNWEFPA